MISGTTTDYTGRLVDIELLQTLTHPAAEQRVHVTNVKTEPKLVAGVQKLAQRYANLFLQELGSIPFAPTNGSNFVANIYGGAAQTAGGLTTAFALANSTVIDQLIAEDIDTTFGGVQPDERIRSADLLDYDIDYATATVKLRIEIVTQAGDTVVFVVPATATR